MTHASIGVTPRGLTFAEAAARLAQHGYNELPGGNRRNLWRTIRNAVSEPTFLLLIGCVLLYFLLGALQDALLLAPFVLLVVGITVFQARRTENALAALRTLSSPRARALRDGAVIFLSARELVVDDVVLVEAGDRVPADARILEAANLEVDESLLTGESVPVTKHPETSIHAGSLIVQGHATALVTATGAGTEIGHIGQSLASIVPPKSPLQLEVVRLVHIVGSAGLLVCMVVVVVYGLTRADWLAGALAGLSVALSMIPEEFPAVFTIFLALSARAMARRNVLTRQPPAVEALSSVTVLCVDKTGTLTFNRMRVERIVTGDAEWRTGPSARALDGPARALVDCGLLASAHRTTDPMEIALATVRGNGEVAAPEGWTSLREYPLTPDLLAVSRLWSCPDGTRTIASKGAPEAIVALCRLEPMHAARALEQADFMARDGLRVLAMARGRCDPDQEPDQPGDIDFEFLGLCGFADPLRPDAARAVAECHSAGIRVIMVTGDHPATAAAIARQAGIGHGERVMTGSELDGLDDAALVLRLAHASVFARTSPAHKLRLVEALKRAGEVVAMTGDGANDAPALKAAHVGLAMGRRGTEVAREAAGLVIADDDFSSIVAGVRAGRRVFDNLRKATRFILAVHIPIAGLSLLPVLLGWPLLLLPAHIAFLELVIDPACSLAFEAEPEESDIMRRPPRHHGARMLDAMSTRLALLQGAIALVAVIGVVLYARARGTDADTVRALGFTTLMLANIGLILANRSLHAQLSAQRLASNRAFWIVSLLALAALAIIVGSATLRELFHFGAPATTGLAVATLAAAVAFALFMVVKPATRAACALPGRPARQ